MKKIIASASIAAVGAASLQAAYTPGLSDTERAKPWSVSTTLRGFFDDNYTTLPANRTDGGPIQKSSFGFDLSPSLSLNVLKDQTLASLSYAYGIRYYENRAENSADHSHQLSAKVEHQFSERYKLNVENSFVVAQEPEVIDPSGGLKLRADGSNVRNTASARFHAEFTRLLGAQFGYSNTMFEFEDEAYESLNRMEHLFMADLRWRPFPATVALVGYNFGIANSEEDIRDNRAHYAFIGADQALMGLKLHASARLGVQYTEYPNAPAGARESTAIPYADLSANYAYMKGCFAQIGVKHTRLQGEVLSLDQEATAIYANVHHQVTPKLACRLMGQYQNAVFNSQDPAIDQKADSYFVVGLNVEYQINQYLSAETGYNLDRLDSELDNRSFTRNRVYLGMRASY